MGKADTDAQADLLIAQYGRLIRKVVSLVAGSRAGFFEDEVEQRVIVALWRQLDREQIIQHPASYVYRAAVRETVRLLREESRFEELDAAAVADGPLAPATDQPDRIYAAREQDAVIEECLRGLRSNRERAVRAHLAGFSVAEIMAMHGWSYQTTRNLIARALADLRRALRSRGIDV